MAALHRLLGPNQSLDCVAFVGGSEVTKLLGVVELVDGDGLLSFEAGAETQVRHLY
jgi:hypothetical protein